jgi:hypothetical protein
MGKDMLEEFMQLQSQLLASVKDLGLASYASSLWAENAPTHLPPIDTLFQLLEEGSYGASSTIEITKGKDAEFHLYYLTIRALADLPALMLEYAGEPYEATYYGRKEFATVKSSFALGRVPVLKHDGLELSQSNSIVRYPPHFPCVLAFLLSTY